MVVVEDKDGDSHLGVDEVEVFREGGFGCVDGGADRGELEFGFLEEDVWT